MALFLWTLRYYFAHAALFSALALIAGVGRAIQTGAVGDVGPWAIWLEFVVEPARVLLLLAAIGRGSLPSGGRALAELFRQRKWKEGVFRARTVLLKEWRMFGIALLMFLVVAVAVNVAVFQLVPGRWPLILFAKNLTIIPFAIVFVASTMLWLTGRITELQQR